MSKILFLTLKTFSFTGGIEKACRSLIKAINTTGHELNTWSMYDRNDSLDPRYTAVDSYKGFGGKKLKFALAIFLKTWKYDQIILSHINLLLFGKIIKTLKPSVKIILWAHGVEVWRTIPQWKRKFLQSKAEIWAVSNYTKQQLMQRHQIADEKIKVLANTIDPLFHTPNAFVKPAPLLERYKINADQFVLFTLTRLSATEHLKNYDLVIASLSSLSATYPNITYIIGGKADSLEQVRLSTLIKEKGLVDKVKIIGFIEERELTDHFLLADCFVLPSQKEGFGIVLIEAAACGCQVIGGNVDGSTDALLNGKLGQLVNPSRVEAINAALVKAIANQNHQPEMQQKLALENFGFERYVKKVDGLLIW